MITWMPELGFITTPITAAAGDWNPLVNPKDPLILLDRTTRTFKALVAPFDACILNGYERPGVCVHPPRDGSNYEYAQSGGETAIIPFKINHARDDMTLSAATDHYANSNHAALIAHYWEDQNAIWASGSVAPTISDAEMELIAHSALSGDWRWVEEERRLRMIASQVVNVPGFRKAHRILTASVSSDGHSMRTEWKDELMIYKERLSKASLRRAEDVSLMIKILQASAVQCSRTLVADSSLTDVGIGTSGSTSIVS